MPKPILKRISESESNNNDSEFNADRIDYLIPSARRTKIFDLLNLVGDLQTNSLDDVLEKAIIEGNRFIEWKKSGKPLNNIQIFHKTGSEFKHISSYDRFSAGQSLEAIIKLRAKPDSQFEIWECNEDYSPKFPLYRIPFSKIIEETDLIINEAIRDDYLLNIEAKRVNKSLLFKISINQLPQEKEVAATGKIRPIGTIPTFVGIYGLLANLAFQYVAAFQKIGQQWLFDYGKRLANVSLCFLIFIISISVLPNIASSSGAKVRLGPIGGTFVAQSHVLFSSSVKNSDETSLVKSDGNKRQTRKTDGERTAEKKSETSKNEVEKTIDIELPAEKNQEMNNLQAKIKEEMETKKDCMRDFGCADFINVPEFTLAKSELPKG